jgi:hypothetical protein
MTIHLFFAYTVPMFDPNVHIPRINKGMIYLGPASLQAYGSPRRRM